MFLLFLVVISFSCSNAYFTIPGQCPDNVSLQKDFKLADFLGKWYQAYYFSSDLQHLNNCSTIELQTRSTGIYFNQSRVDRKYFHKYSIAKVEIPTSLDDAARMDVTFEFQDAPRRLTSRRYPFRVLATNYKYYATVYTCNYSPLINKTFIYIWILSRNPILNDVSKELALKPLQKAGITEKDLVKDQHECSPKYYEDRVADPMTFRYPVPVLV